MLKQLLEKDNTEILTEMATIGELRGNVKISIYPEPLGSASFHIKTTDWEIVVGIKDFSVLEVKYGKAPFKKKDKISGELKKKLIEFFNDTMEDGRTYWNFLLLTWNANNSKYKISIDTKNPELSFRDME